MDTEPTADQSLPSAAMARVAAEIDKMINRLQQAAPASALDWRKSFDITTESIHLPNRFMVAVVGASGSGKSSLINSLLGAHVVPTSALRSCTSAPIEVSFGYTPDTEIHVDFISKESWMVEIQHLLGALAEDKNTTNLQEDGKQAWDRVHAVYPSLSTDNLLQKSLADILACDPVILDKLGKTEHKVVPFVGSELNDFTRSNDNGDTVNLWPIVSRVRIRYPAPVLRTGAVIVDLPGLQDSNSARAAAYKDYLRRCDYILIVANIKRAATDQVARGLLSDAFRSQMIMDGRFNSDSISFVGTCSDHVVNFQEIVDDLQLAWDGDWHQLADKLATIRSRRTQTAQAIQTLPTSHEKTPEVRKRKSSYRSTPVSKRQKLGPIEQKRAQLQKRLTVLADEENRSLIACARFCALKRNEWAVNEIKGQFWDGLHELCDDVDETNEIRVFTVSACEYNRLHGISVGEHASSLYASILPPIFETEDETGIPALVNFITELGQKADQHIHAQHSAHLGQVVKQMQIWLSAALDPSHPDRAILRAVWNSASVSHDGTSISCTEDMQRQSGRIAKGIRDRVMKNINDKLIPELDRAAETAESNVVSHMAKVGQEVKYWATMKAIFRRDGVWKTHNWNSAAVEVLSREVAKEWNQVLGAHGVPDETASVVDTLRIRLKRLERKLGKETSVAALLELCQARALEIAQKTASEALNQCRKGIREDQMNISRKMSTFIEGKLASLYKRCMDHRGKGARQLSLDMFSAGLDDVKSEIYSTIVAQTKTALQDSVKLHLEAYVKRLEAIATEVEKNMSPIWDNLQAGRGDMEMYRQIQSKLCDVEKELAEFTSK